MSKLLLLVLNIPKLRGLNDDQRRMVDASKARINSILGEFTVRSFGSWLLPERCLSVFCHEMSCEIPKFLDIADCCMLSYETYPIDFVGHKLLTGCGEKFVKLDDLVLDDIADIASAAVKKSFPLSVNSVTRKSLRGLKRIEQKLSSFLPRDHYLLGIRDLIRMVLKEIPSRGAIDDRLLLTVRGCYKVIADRNVCFTYAKQLDNYSYSPSKAYDSLLRIGGCDD